MGKQEKLSKKEALLKRLFYNPSKPGAFSGVTSLQYAAIRANKNKRIKIKKSDVKGFLQKQDTYTLHKLPRKNYTRRRVVVSGPLEQYQADLVDMQNFADENEDYRWILMMLDVFSKKAVAVRVKRKDTSSMVAALKEAFTRVEPPRKLQTDKGLEFRNKGVQDLLKTLGVEWFSSEDDATKASVVERLNRTIKGKMYMAFHAQRNHKWLELLPKLIEGYNQTRHSSIRMTPNEAASMNPETVAQVRENLYGPGNRLDGPRRFKEAVQPIDKSEFKVGDYVRIVKSRVVFEKMYLPNYTNEIFVIKEIVNSTPKGYWLEDLRGEDIRGYFYGIELQKVAKPEVFEVEQVLEEKGNRVLVKWKGYGPQFNQWIDRRDFKK